jgi:hypothetical protein
VKRRVPIGTRRFSTRPAAFVLRCDRPEALVTLARARIRVPHYDDVESVIASMALRHPDAFRQDSGVAFRDYHDWLSRLDLLEQYPLFRGDLDAALADTGSIPANGSSTYCGTASPPPARASISTVSRNLPRKTWPRSWRAGPKLGNDLCQLAAIGRGTAESALHPASPGESGLICRRTTSKVTDGQPATSALLSGLGSATEHAPSEATRLGRQWPITQLEDELRESLGRVVFAGLEPRDRHP